MLERSIFINALERETAAERSAFLDEACAHDPALRQRVEALLQSHGTAGTFLGKPVPERLAEQLERPPGTAETQPPQADGDDELELTFLASSDRPESLGKLGHYEVQEVIGRGGMGVVLRAFDEKLHRMVAIKVMSPLLTTSAAARKRFSREARAAAAVTHDHIVTIHAVEEANNLPYLVMQYISGLSLEQRLDRTGPLALAEVLRIGMQTATGLSAAHAQGLIHRDIKPANILLENGIERVKITDFGLARAAADASVTQTGVVAGTPQYMAPEQARGEALDARADLFSLGSVLYAMCTGRTPFRASGSMAVLKRVCEETPTPIREINPDIPQWLVGIIDKLHAKNPDDRFQSAAEVADMLGWHLAQVQHPSALGQVSNLPRKSNAGWQPTPGSRLWAAAAVALFCVLAGVGLSEATGTTQLTATVIRIFTPSGTLVVETDDSAVSVTVEGDGGLVITGAGPQEVRLRPGSYKVRATKDGKSVRAEELITISRGGKQVVKVRMEDQAPATVSRSSGEIRRFEGHTHHVWSVAYSPDGRHALSGGADSTVRLWDIKTGKELRCFEGQTGAVSGVSVSSDGKLGLSSDGDGYVIVWDLETGKEVRRCDRHTDPLYCVAVSPDDKLALAGTRGVIILWDLQTGKELRRFVGHKDNIYSVAFSPDGRHILSGGGAEHKTGGYPPGSDHSVRWWDVETGEALTTFKGHTLWVQRVAVSPDGRSALSASYDGTIRHWDLETGKQLRFFVHPSGALAVAFSPDGRFVVSGGGSPYYLYLWDLKTGKQLHRFEGHTHKVQSLASSPDGHSFVSGSWDGTLHLWQMPEAGSGQVTKADAPKAEPMAFVLLGGQGVAERKLDTLAEAVQAASDGDTIEVRDNGPFVTAPIIVKGHQGLTLRAGAGFRPVIRMSTHGLRSETSLLFTDGPLTLEGLEFQLESPRSQEWPKYKFDIVRSASAPLSLANCRLIFKAPGACLVVQESSDCQLRNCEFLTTKGGFLNWTTPASQGRLVMDNCVQAGSQDGYLAVGSSVHVPRGISLAITNSTRIADHGQFMVGLGWPRDPEALNDPINSIRIETAANVFDVENSMFEMHQQPGSYKGSEPLGAAQAQQWLQRLVKWQDQRSLYSVRGPYQTFGADQQRLEAAIPINTLDDWKKFWGDSDSASSEGRVRYQGGNLAARLTAAPEQLTPDDFRLRADSAGYRAGPDGMDLGADVDLVGPGPAYERWKQTPEYQQWLKETGQAGRASKIDSVLRQASEYVARGDLEQGAEQFSLAMSLVADPNPYGTERLRIVNQFVPSDEIFQRVLKLRPDDVHLWSHRAHHMAKVGRWDESIACYRKRLELGPDGAGLWQIYSLALLANNDEADYRDLCEQMLVTFADESNASEAAFAALTMAILPDSVQDKQRAFGLAERAAKGRPDDFWWINATYAAWLYRFDRLEEAIIWLDKSKEEDYQGFSLCFLAMAHHRLGHAGVARQYADAVRQKKSEWTEATTWYHRVRVERLIVEMDTVLAAEPDKVHAPQAEDTNPPTTM